MSEPKPETFDEYKEELLKQAREVKASGEKTLVDYMTEPKPEAPREFLLSLSDHKRVNGQYHIVETKNIFGFPSPQWHHVIEKSAYDAIKAMLAEAEVRIASLLDAIDSHFGVGYRFLNSVAAEQAREYLAKEPVPENGAYTPGVGFFDEQYGGPSERE